MNTGLPKAACIGGRCFRIRSDFREILDICAALNDPELTDQDRAEVAVKIFYPDWDQIADMAAAVKFMLWFLDGGVDRGDQRQQPKQMDWEQDFPMIIGTDQPRSRAGRARAAVYALVDVHRLLHGDR